MPKWKIRNLSLKANSSEKRLWLRLSEYLMRWHWVINHCIIFIITCLYCGQLLVMGWNMVICYTKGVDYVSVWSRELTVTDLCFIFLKTRYEVAPRSDSEESGSEFEEEVSDFLQFKWMLLNRIYSTSRWDQLWMYTHTHTKYIKIQQGAVDECTLVMLWFS